MIFCDELQQFMRNKYMKRVEGDEIWRKSCFNGVKKLVDIAQTEEISAEDSCLLGELIAEILRDNHLANSFLKRSFSKRAEDLDDYCKMHYAQAYKLWHCALSGREIFEKMAAYTFFFQNPEMQCGETVKLSQSEFKMLEDALFSLVESVLHNNYARFIRSVNEEEIIYVGQYVPLNMFMPELCRWLIRHSTSVDRVIACGEVFLRARLDGRNQRSDDIKAVVYEGDEELFWTLGEAYWARGDVSSKLKGFEYLWIGVKESDSMFPPGSEKNVTFLKDLFHKAEELDISNKSKWKELLADMEYINKYVSADLFSKQMIEECAKRAQ